jgi:hypothetical protein
MFQPAQNRRAYEELRSLPPLSELQLIPTRQGETPSNCRTQFRALQRRLGWLRSSLNSLMNLHDLIEEAAFAWITQEKANAQSLPGQIARHIEKTGKLRLPQRQAIEIYLWLKLVGLNRPLAEIIRTGTLRDQTNRPPALRVNATAEFLFRFAKGQWEVSVKQYFSPYLKAKIDEFNAKRGKKNGGELVETNGNGAGEENGNAGEAATPSVPFKPVTISAKGLELIEAIQFDTTLRKDGVWVSNAMLEDKAGPKEKIKGRYTVKAKNFKVKIRNIAGDEIILEHPPAKA